MILCHYQLNDSPFLVPNLAELHWGFFLQQNKIKNMCNVLTLDDMHASLPDVKYRSPPSMIHRHRVPLFANQSLLCSSHILAHSCASHPLGCKCSAQSRLSMTITALAVYQAWLCPLVWCCLIHHEDLNRSFILCTILRIVIAWIVRIVPTPSWLSISHELASSWNNTLQVYVITSLHGNHLVVQTCIS